jgi:hypothetical protein
MLGSFTLRSGMGLRRDQFVVPVVCCVCSCVQVEEQAKGGKGKGKK